MAYPETLASGPAQASRTMDRVGPAADRISSICDRVSGILARFTHGEQPVSGTAGDAPVSISYIDQISRLHGNIDLLDKLTAELAELA